MVKTNISNLQEDEALADEVKKHKCLYEKTDRGFKDLDRTRNAWSAVESALGYEKGTASKRFLALRKRFSRKRKEQSECCLFGSRENDVFEQAIDFKGYSFLNWLSPYIRSRKGKRNIGLLFEKQNNVVKRHEARSGFAEGLDNLENNVESSDESLDVQRTSSSRNLDIMQKDGRLTPLVTKNKVIVNDFDDSEIELMKVRIDEMQQKLQQRKAPEGITPEDHFGNLISSELKELPQKIRVLAKNEINGIIMKYQLQACDHSFQSNVVQANTYSSHSTENSFSMDQGSSQ